MARCVDMRNHKLFGMKSHDCHVFMQRSIPVAFSELLPSHVWKAFIELSLFFKVLTTIVIKKGDMVRLEKEIPLILCNLKRIFPPSFFNSMEHLPVCLMKQRLLVLYNIDGYIHLRGKKRTYFNVLYNSKFF